MYFKNEITGLVWQITDKSQQKRLQADTGYSVVTDINTKNTTTESHQEHVREPIAEKVDYKAMKWADLRKLAIDEGISINGKKRKVIEQELEEMGGVNDR